MDFIDEIAGTRPHKVVLSGARGGYRKLVFARKVIKGESAYQIEKYTETQVFHENIREEQLAESLELYFPSEFKQLNAFSTTTDYDVKAGKKGNFAINRRQAATGRIVVTGNNRKKKYILEEGMAIPAFYDLGIFTKEGKVAASKYDKFRQINRFIEMVDDVLKHDAKECIRIIDFGCGKSYLTFFLYYYIVEILHKQAYITGLDLKKQVIQNCNVLAEKYGYCGLTFEVGDINGYRSDRDVDMIVTLHACDMATDYALYHAICWNTKYILSVPCCQHELNKKICSEELSALTKYGIIKERTAALMTDAIRGCILEACGYKTELLEFVDMEHSPKNILIRAEKRPISAAKRCQSWKEAERLCQMFGTDQTLMELVRPRMEKQAEELE